MPTDRHAIPHIYSLPVDVKPYFQIHPNVSDLLYNICATDRQTFLTGHNYFRCDMSRADSKLVPSQWEASLQSNTLSLAGSKPRINPESRRSASYQGNFGAFQSKHQSLVVLNLCMTDGFYDNVIKWNQFPRYWLLCGESTPWRRCLMFSLICAWANNRDSGDLRGHRAHYDVTVMVPPKWLVIRTRTSW